MPNGRLRLPRIRLTPIAIASITRAYFLGRKNSPEAQEAFLLPHITKNKRTAYGERYAFHLIQSVKDFQRIVPVAHYDEMYPRIYKALGGQKNVLVRGPIERFATSSGTTGKNKYIPVTNAALKYNQYRGTMDTMMYYAKANSHTTIRQGKALVIGGWFSRNPLTGKKNVWFISAIMQKNSPLLAKRMKQPKANISYLVDRQKKVEKMIQLSTRKNITSISGQPSRCSAYLEKMVTTMGKQNALEIRPNFQLVVRWGMGMELHKEIFHRLLPSDDVQYYQVYNASEWFFACQHENGRDDMLLLLDHKVFYEFIPLKEYMRGQYDTCLMVDQVELNQQYVILITNNAGLRRYVLGDTIVFTGKDPYTIRITGRTKYCIDVAGECTPLEPIEQTLCAVAEKYHGEIEHYTVAPGKMERVSQGCYEVAIERRKAPSCDAETFARELDEELGKKWAYYYDERHDTHMLQPLLVRFVPDGTFEHRLESKGKLGGQHKIPKVSNDRRVMDEI